MNKFGHLVVFARVPRIGRVKRRLAAEIGDVAAWQAYRSMTTRTLRTLGQMRRWRRWLAIDQAHAGGRGDSTWPEDWMRIAQGQGDLGQRLTRVANRLPPGPVVIVGSDIPTIGIDHIARAFRALSRADLVFGPAMDGGYWLIGFKRRRMLQRLFIDVNWSSRGSLADTLANAGRWQIVYLDLLEDIDTAAGLRRWHDRALAATGPEAQVRPLRTSTRNRIRGERNLWRRRA